MTAALRQPGEDTGEITPLAPIRQQYGLIGGPSIDDRRHRTYTGATVYSTATVEQLVEWAQAGDAEAFGGIYDRYLRTVYRFIYFRVGNQATAEDLTGDVFIRALDRIGSFAWMGRDFGAWLITIARNLVADHFKSARVRTTTVTDDPGLGDHAAPYDADNPADAALADELAYQTRVALKYLTPDQRTCLRLRFLVGLSLDETAAAMDRPIAAVKALQYRGTRRAQEWLLTDGFTR